MARLGTRVSTGADRVVRKVALAVDQVVVMSTPVDTGRARANWIASLSTPSRAVNGEPGSPGAGTNAALSQARQAVAEYDGDRHTSINISNNLPYIGELDRGTSRQAPAGFVKSAVETGVRSVKGARILGD